MEEEGHSTCTRIKIKEMSVSDREILKVIREERRLPLSFSRPIKLSKLVAFYDKYWAGDFTDDSSFSSDS